MSNKNGQVRQRGAAGARHFGRGPRWNGDRELSGLHVRHEHGIGIDNARVSGPAGHGRYKAMMLTGVDMNFDIANMGTKYNGETKRASMNSHRVTKIQVSLRYELRVVNNPLIKVSASASKSAALSTTSTFHENVDILPDLRQNETLLSRSLPPTEHVGSIIGSDC